MAQDESWKATAFRQRVASILDDAIQRSGVQTTKNGTELEKDIFQSINSKEEYLGYSARTVLRIRGSGPMAGRSRKSLQEMEVPENIVMPSLESGSIFPSEGYCLLDDKYKGNYVWRTPAFRRAVIASMGKAVGTYGNPTLKNCTEMERLLYDKAKTRDDYLSFVKRVMDRIEEKGPPHGGKVTDISDLIPGVGIFPHFNICRVAYGISEQGTPYNRRKLQGG